MNATGLRITLGLVSVVGLVALWWLYVALTGVPPYVLPRPEVVGAEIVRLFASGSIWPHLAHTLGVLLAGFAIGSVAGALLGCVLAKAPRVERVVGPYLFFFQTAPKIALAPLFILWFGLGLASQLVLVVSLVFFPVMVGALLGMHSVPARLRDLAGILKMTPIQRLRLVELPSAVPELFAGLKVAAVQATIGAILSEWMSGDSGLGYLMVFASTTYRTPLLFAMVLLTALLGIVLYQSLALIERRLLSWR
ncbi:MAG: ABC transporter permease [Azospirillaceae bacterium]